MSAAKPRALLLHPQRGVTSVVLGLAGLGFLPACVYGALYPVDPLSVRTFIGLLAGFGVSLGFIAIGLATWFGSVEFVLTRRHLELIKRSLRGREDRRKLDRKSIVDVIIETYDGNARLVIETRGERVPLTASFTTGDLRAHAIEMRRFLELPADPPVRVLPCVDPAA